GNTFRKVIKHPVSRAGARGYIFASRAGLPCISKRLLRSVAYSKRFEFKKPTGNTFRKVIKLPVSRAGARGYISVSRAGLPCTSKRLLRSVAYSKRFEFKKPIGNTFRKVIKLPISARGYIFVSQAGLPCISKRYALNGSKFETALFFNKHLPISPNHLKCFFLFEFIGFFN